MTVDKYHHPRCFLDVEIDGEPVGRIIMELFFDTCPITCENFKALCTGEKGIGKTTEKPLHYKGAPFHRVVKNFVIQGGDFVAGNGAGGESIYGGVFKDENFDLPHDKPFLLSMSNRGPDTNGSQFFITTQPAPHLNGKHTVFGRVISGFEVVSEIESIKTDQGCTPCKDVRIKNCGELVRKIKQKEKRPVESSLSEAESEKIKKKRRKEKHKKHKREKKEIKSSIVTRKEPEESGCMVDPEEIPEVPANNFLLRRTSPVGDSMRRTMPRDREFQSYRPARSRSGRKIKGRGFMRYRTPSRSTSRSGSETPPHWKQAQSRLQKIKDVVPIKPTVTSDQSQSENEEMEDHPLKIVPLQSRLGAFSRDEDARATLQSRRNRNRNSPDSPLKWTNSWKDNENERVSSRRSRGERDSTRASPLRSKIVVKSGFGKDSENRFRDRDRFDNRGNRRTDISPRRRSDDRDSKYDRQSHRRRPSVSDLSEQERKSSKAVDHKSEKATALQKKKFRSLEDDLFRYRKDATRYSSSDDENSKKKVSKKSNEAIPQTSQQKDKKEISQKQKDTFKSLATDLFRYNKNVVLDSDDDPEPNKSKPKHHSNNLPTKSKNSVEKKEVTISSAELFRYNKSVVVDSDEDSQPQKIKPKPHSKHLAANNKNSSEERDNNDSPMSPIQEKVISHSPDNNFAPDQAEKGGESDTNDSFANMPENIPVQFNVGDPAKADEKSEKDSLDDAEIVTSSGQPLDDRTSTDSFEMQYPTSQPHAKEGSRWDVKNYPPLPNPDRTEREGNLETFEQIPIFDAFDSSLADIVPLPEESEPIKLATKQSHPPDIDDDNSTQHEMDIPSPEPRKNLSELKQVINKEIVIKAEKVEPENIRKSPRSSKSRESSSPPVFLPKRKVSKSKSPEKSTTKKKSPTYKTRSRSVSPIEQLRRRARAERHSRSRSRSKRRSQSPSRNRTRRRSPDVRARRSRSHGRTDRERRRNSGGGKTSTRSPDRRKSYSRRYSKSPGYRGRRTQNRAKRSRSRSPLRGRRKHRESSSNSDSSSSRKSSSSRSATRKRKSRRTKVQRTSSSSSSSSSKRSGSAST